MAVSQSHTFKISDYEIEKRKWKSPHEDLFSFSPIEPESTFEWSGLVLDSPEKINNIESDKLHIALKACHESVLKNSQKVTEVKVYLLQFVRHLLNTVDQSSKEEDSQFLIKISDENVKMLQAFAEKKEFSSSEYATVYDLLKEIIRPSKYILPVSPTVTNTISSLFAYCGNSFVSFFHLFAGQTKTSELLNHCSIYLPLLTFVFCRLRGHSLIATITSGVVVVLLIAYGVKYQYALTAAEAEKMAKFAQRNDIPPECRPGEMTFFEKVWSFFRPVVSSEDRCYAYWKDQLKEPMVEPDTVFFNVAFSFLDVLMEKLGNGIGLFIKSFRKHFGILENVAMIPFALITLIVLMGIGISAVLGGSLYIPYFGRVYSQERGRARVADSQPHSSSRQPEAQSLSAGRDIKVFNYFHGGVVAGTSPEHVQAAIREAVTVASGGPHTTGDPPSPQATAGQISARRNTIQQDVLSSILNTVGTAIGAQLLSTPQNSQSSSSPAGNVASEPPPQNSQSSHSSAGVRSPQGSNSNESYSGERAERGSGDCARMPKMHRMHSSGITPANVSRESGHIRSRSLPRNLTYDKKHV